MQIEIYVVTTKLRSAIDINLLEMELKHLVKVYQGLTVIPQLAGYWVNSKGEIESDNVQIWRILIDKLEDKKHLEQCILAIKSITEQESQLYSIDNEPKFL